MFDCLKDSQYYIDLYDLHTIEECLNNYKFIKDKLDKKRYSEKIQELDDKKFDKETSKIANYYINPIKIQRYKNKKDTIQKWIIRDRINQERINKASPPKGVLCKR